jgi:hypothetical protein
MTDLRLAYHEIGRAVRLDELTCRPGELRGAIERIISAWNEAIPRNRVRIVNQPRYMDLLGALRVFTPDEICQAVHWYGKQTWQRTRNAWCTFDSFLAEDRLTQWVESSMEHDERAALAQQHRAAAQTAGQAKARAVDAVAERRQAQAEAFDAVPGPQRYRLLEQAKRLLPRVLQNNAAQVRLRAIAMMAEQGKESHERRTQ